MIIGIISEQNEENMPLYGKILRRQTAEAWKSTKNMFDTVAVHLPYTADEFPRQKRKKQVAAVRRAYDYLIEHGAEYIFFTEKLGYCREFFSDSEKLRFADGRECFFGIIPQVVRTAAKMCGIDLMCARVGIRDGGMDRITENLVRAMCFDVKNLSIFTNNPEHIQDFCGELFEETGFLPRVEKDSGAEYRVDVFIDLARRCVRVGRDIVIDRVKFDFDLNGLDVDTMGIAVCVCGDARVRFETAADCGKFVLTLC